MGAYSQYLQILDKNKLYYIVITGQTGLNIGLSVHKPSIYLKLS